MIDLTYKTGEWLNINVDYSGENLTEFARETFDYENRFEILTVYKKNDLPFHDSAWLDF
jgi:hypothetical protein